MALFGREKPNALVADARSVIEDASARGEASITYERWQDEGWAMYDNLGEYRQGITWKSNVVSRARLVAAYAPDRPGDEPTPIDDKNDPAVALVDAIAGGIGGQSELLRSMTVHLDVPGEGWFVGNVSIVDGVDLSWTVYGAEEVRPAPGQNKMYQIRTGSSGWTTLPSNAVPVRVWRPHDRFHWMADSSTRAALPIMRRLELLNRHVDANALSRLASNGVYWISSEIMFPQDPDDPDGTDPFVKEFMGNGVIAIKTPGSAAAAFPMVNRAPFQYIKDGIRYDTFSTPFDQKVLDLREFEVKRLSTALDVPPEVLLGMAGMNHWGAWQVEESALKTTVSSTLELICWALTRNYLAPGLRSMAQTGDEVRRRIVWYDTSELSVRPDRSQDAIKLGNELLLNTDALFRETGFDNSDLLKDDEEMRKRVGLHLVASNVPASVSIGLALLGLGQLPQTAGIDVIGDENAPPLEIPPSRLPSGNGDQPGTPITQTDPARPSNPRPVQNGQRV